MLSPPAALISWMQAAEIIGCTDRTVRRWRFEHDGYEGLLDRRRARRPRWAVPRPVRLYPDGRDATAAA